MQSPPKQQKSESGVTKPSNTLQRQAPKPSDTPAKSQLSVFDSVSFPQESCGDNPPNDPKAYPVKFYPVFIDYNENNFKTVTSMYCRDALKKLRKETGKEAIQVSSFLSFERANQFNFFLQDKLGSGEVGDPILSKAKQSPNRISVPTHQTTDAITKAALLTPTQVKQLLSVSKNVRLENGETKKLEIVVPTYIPPGFKLDQLEISDGDYPGYSIDYRNSNNICFGFGVFTAPGAGSPGEYDTVEVVAPAFGKVTLAYTDFDDFSGKPLVAFANYHSNVRDQKIGKYVGKYSFSSHGEIDKNCNAISLRSAIKIVESLQFIDP
ncbi:DUF4367 domain-containing protein [Trichocoleus sp. ST-U3]